MCKGAEHRAHHHSAPAPSQCASTTTVHQHHHSAPAPPQRISAEFALLAQDDDQTKNLYQVAKLRGTISVLLQLGQQTGRMMAVYLPAVKPEMPLFDDSAERLAWRFSNNLAEGTNNDELYIAFA